MTTETANPRRGDLPDATVPEATSGRVEAIHLADVAAGPMRAVPRVRAIAGVGLEGDRYANGTGTYSPDPRTDRHVTLIEAEEIESLAERDGIELAAGETRRNITTRGIRLNDLVGRRFRVGSVECEATRLCEPCQGLTDLLEKPVLKPLAHRAGLRALILTDGEIALGDEVIALDP
jgi:MOSC domain-containing protein YiiM